MIQEIYRYANPLDERTYEFLFSKLNIMSKITDYSLQNVNWILQITGECNYSYSEAVKFYGELKYKI
jgi:hypothetical protein